MRADFTSALYLGMRHGARSLPAWDALTLGKPAALEPVPGETELGAALARLMDCESACLLPSSLHLFWDLFGWLAAAPVALLLDGAAYPVARWGAERARALGTPLACFGHGNAGQAARLARRWRAAGRQPVILADGYTPGDEGAPPLAAYADIAQAHGGLLLLDDTQALGVLGPAGGGSVAAHGLGGAPVLAGASLAKGFGAPLAVLAGPRALLGSFMASSATRVHCSPPSVAAIAAGSSALAANRRAGRGLRKRLGERVAQLQSALADGGLRCAGGAFPVQRIVLPPSCDGPALRRDLSLAGVDVLLQGSRARPVLTLLLRADHSAQQVAFAARLIVQLVEVQHV
ncbi:aminotransferase class I/II-fold pyridoxal phosphate-dependent enzyme [Pseudoduganella violaceinigra]|uniref:aminotransferase class I/II-fold pyridoxal phosphate-dependent enzyme n=1 Tax=Pseudoduganella violaceinigra TaxID=246602 RepID=UPI000404A033|nr:aminotransferase class I/II-fold pyridoxal phosphate-dependent enzyme [Pseudoduganella violaceinigra]